MKPLLRWAGSKRQILPHLRKFWTDGDHTYIEPFCGSASLFFDIQPKRAILGDLNSELILSLRAIKRDPTLVLQCLKRYPIGEKAYYKIRSYDPNLLSNFERAARFIYLNHYCFNGLYRTNSKGRFNVPYGNGGRKSLIDDSEVLAASMTLQGAHIVISDFEETVRKASPGDFIYLDPPYVLKTRRMFFEYLPNTFCAADIKRLIGCIKYIDSINARFVLSYVHTKEIYELFSRWRRIRISVNRNIAGFAGARRKAYELLITNIV